MPSGHHGLTSFRRRGPTTLSKRTAPDCPTPDAVELTRAGHSQYRSPLMQGYTGT